MDVTQLLLNNPTVTAVRAQFASGNPSHAYLLQTDSDIAPQLLRVLSAFALCPVKGGGCMTCRSCVNAMKGVHSDAVFYPPDGSRSYVSVDDVLDLIKQSGTSCVEGANKVFLLDVTKSGVNNIWQNKILKILEETPDNVFIFIATNNLGEILDTVRSRCFTLTVEANTIEDIRDYLIAHGYERVDAEIAAVLSKGNIVGAEKALADGTDREIFDDLILTFCNMTNTRQSAEYVAKLLAYKNKSKEMLTLMQAIFRDALLVKNSSSLPLLNGNKNDIITISDNYSESAIVEILRVIDFNYAKLVKNCNFTVVMDNLILKILEVRYRCRI